MFLIAWLSAAVLLTLLWCGAAIFLILCARQVRRLDGKLGLPPAGGAGPSRHAGPAPAVAPAGRPEPPTPGLPSLSVVIAARDEAAGIEATVGALLEQRYDGLEIIVVDDRSADDTGVILDRLAARAGGRLVVIHNTRLPDGWIGKCHACHLGASRARGTWLLFMDGDVELLRDDLLARIAGLAERERLDHLAVTPDTRPMSALQSAVMGVFGHMFFLGAYAHEIDRDRRRGGAGIGAFNMVRRSAYERVGGHTLLRMDPGDDFKLGRLLKESGARQRLLDGIGLIRCPWQRGVAGIVRGLEKNFFAGFDYSVAFTAGFALLVLFLYFGPLAAALLMPAGAGRAGGAPEWAGPALAALRLAPILAQAATLLAAACVQVGRQGGNPIVQTLLYPAGALILLVALGNSAFRTLRRGGIVWRETFYPLADLRRGLVRRGDGRRLIPAGPSPQPRPGSRPLL